jgi:hypothetical protein
VAFASYPQGLEIVFGNNALRLNSVWAKQGLRRSVTETPMCQNSLTLETEGKPDIHCFVDASFAKNRKGQSTETSLEMLLGRLGVRNFFTASHVPPKITLNFTRKCQFPTPPYLY